MTFMNKILTYLGFCPSKESAQGFRVRNKANTLKQKEYRNAIIGGIGGGISVGVLFAIFFFLHRGKFLGRLYSYIQYFMQLLIS